MSVDLGTLGKTVFREVMSIKKLPNPRKHIKNITRNLDALERLGMPPNRIALLQKSIIDFSDMVRIFGDVLIEKRKILNQTIDSKGPSLATFTEFKNLSILSVFIKNFSDKETSFIHRMHDHLYTLIDRDIDALPTTGYPFDTMKKITKNFALLTRFLQTLGEKMDATFSAVSIRANEAGNTRHNGHLVADTEAAGRRLIDLLEELFQLSAKYDEVVSTLRK